MENNKTDLAKILSVSGQHGLFLYIAQARSGVIAENLESKKRVCLDYKSKITTLADISIYTAEGEIKLQEVLEKIHAVLGDKPAPSSKDDPKAIKALFDEAVPDYDEDRFYLSHMKKVVDWYRDLSSHASLDFVTEEDKEAETPAQE